jgi:hypothetical protein
MRRILVPTLLLLSLSLPLPPSARAEELAPWREYRTILWLSGTTLKQAPSFDELLRVLQEMGVNTGMVSNGGNAAPFAKAGFPFYVENVVPRGLCLKFSSHVTNWSAFINDWSKQRSEAAFVRDYCLDGAEWRKDALREVRDAARRMGPFRPLAYDLRDELSTTDSANPFDYDFAPAALAEFRRWLKTQYHDLPALNREWATDFAGWDEVKPFSTDRIKARMAGATQPNGQPDWGELARMKFDPATAAKQPARWNFAPWCDFRTYMDVSLARALGDLRSAVHEADPRTPVGVEGTQMPSAWGGYDLWRLAQVLDWVEPYDIGNSREILGSFMPGKPFLTTVGERDARAARRRLWHLLLQGDRGCIVWWSDDSVVLENGHLALTPRARELAPVLRELTSPLAALFVRAEREFDPVAIHYSQASIQVDWLLESTVDGRTWPRRFSSFEASHNQLVRVRNGWLKALQDLGYSPRFVASEQIARGEAPFRALVLPGSLAMADEETKQLAAAKTVLVSEAECGHFDEHGRLRTTPPALKPTVLTGAEEYTKTRLQKEPDPAFPARLAQILAAVPPAFRLDPAARVALFRYRLGDVRLLALERNIDYRMSEELKQAGGNEALEQRVTVAVPLPAESHVYDLRTGAHAGLLKELRVSVDAWAPSLYALAPRRLEGNVVEALARSAR